MSPTKWARVAQAEAYGLRRGAWYPVVSSSSAALVLLDVNKANRPVNRLSLEFTDEKPSMWSVVRRKPSDLAAQRAKEKALGPVYVVCPTCRARSTVGASAGQLTCEECGRTAEVDWEHPC